MKYNATLLALAVATVTSVASARDLPYQSFAANMKREVSQGHSHEAVLLANHAVVNLLTPAVTEEDILAARAVAEDDTCEDDGTGDDDAGDDDTCEDDGTGDDDAGDDDTCEDDGTGDDTGDDDTCEDDGTGDDNNTGGGNNTVPAAPATPATPATPAAPAAGNNTGAGNTAGAGNNTGAGSNTGGANNTAGGVNVQSFTGTLGGAAPAVLFTAGSARPYSVNGNTFSQSSEALTRSCDIQNNACFNAANTGKLTGGTAQCVQQTSDCKKAAAAKTTVNTKFRREASKLGRRHGGGGLDFGSCGTPQIQFAKGLDGHGEEESFQAVNGQDFNHGSALNIKDISDFVCQMLQDSCKASAETVAACKQASSAAAAAEGQQAAFLFNAALGV